MGSQGALPKALGHVHPVRRTPANAILLLGVLALAIGIPLGFALGPAQMFGFLASAGSLGIISVYVAIAIAGMVFFRRNLSTGWSVIKHVVVPVVGGVLGLFALFASVYPAPPFPFDIPPYIMLTWILVGVVVVLAMRKRQPQKLQELGRVLSEEAE